MNFEQTTLSIVLLTLHWRITANFVKFIMKRLNKQLHSSMQSSSIRYYNAKHTSLTLNTMMYLKLFYDYTIFSLMNRKLSNQWVDSFYIIKHVRELVYQLKLSFIMWIHSVMSITQLKLISSFKDNLYKHQSHMNSSSVKNKNTFNNVESLSYEINHILNKQTTQHDHSKPTEQYLIK